MIVRWPGRVRPGQVSDHVWAHWDFLPTAAALAGILKPPVPSRLDGSSQLPTLLGRSQKSAPYLYWEFFERGYDQALRSGDWKVVRHGVDGPLELYDLKQDPAESRDLAAMRPDVRRRLEGLLRAARTESGIWSPKPGPK